MKFKFQKTIGNTVFTFEDECSTNKEFFEKVSFYTTLPEEGPNGERDLEVIHKTVKGYEFYEIKSPSSQMTQAYGQYKEGNGRLFGKKWEKVQYGEKQFDTSSMNEVPTPKDDEMPF